MMSVHVPDDVEKQLLQDPTAMTADRQYNSTFAGKGAMLSDTKTVLREIDAGRHPDQVRRAAVEDDLLDALVYLHSQEPPIIHRDIKPSNVCITPEGKAVLLDFGIARRLDKTSTQTGAQAHSMHYSPVEQYPAETRGSYSILQR